MRMKNNKINDDKGALHYEILLCTSWRAYNTSENTEGFL